MPSGRASRASQHFLTILAFLPNLASNALAAPTAVSTDIPTELPDLSQYIPQNIANAMVKTVGLFVDQRPYEPATGLGMDYGLDIGVEITLIKIPDDFSKAIADSGLPAPISPVPSLPLPRLQIHKGIGDHFDLGGSIVQYQNYKIYGGDAKVVFSQPEEGPTYAFRMCFAYANLGIIETRTYTPQLVMSKKIDFADPYIGVGYTWVTGRLKLDIPLPAEIAANVPPGIDVPTSVHLEKSGSGSAALFFTGVALRIPFIGAKITLEGAYSTAGASTLGTKIGISI